MFLWFLQEKSCCLMKFFNTCFLFRQSSEAGVPCTDKLRDSFKRFHVHVLTCPEVRAYPEFFQETSCCFINRHFVSSIFRGIYPLFRPSCDSFKRIKIVWWNSSIQTICSFSLPRQVSLVQTNYVICSREFMRYFLNCLFYFVHCIFWTSSNYGFYSDYRFDIF